MERETETSEKYQKRIAFEKLKKEPCICRAFLFKKAVLFDFQFFNLRYKAIFVKMKWIKNIALISVLLAVFLVFGKKDKKAYSIDFSSKKTIEQIDFLKASAFAKQETAQRLGNTSRADLPIYAKWFESFYSSSFSEFSLFKANTIFARQDINRCSKVSILLFPYHFFW